MSFEDYYINYIRKLFSADVFRRGIQCYSDGHISHIFIDEKIIMAEVKGSQSEPYQVHIEKDINGKVTNIKCTCPYQLYCKHVAAVLIHFAKNGAESSIQRVLTNPLSEPERPNEDRVVEIKERKQKSFLQKLMDDMTGAEKISAITARVKERWKLIFFLREQKERYHFDYTEYPSFHIALGLVYIKKDGSFGRIIDFKKDKLTEPINNELEKKIFNTLITKPHFSADLSAYFDILLENKNLPLYAKKNSNYYETKFYDIKKTIIDFQLRAVDFREISYEFLLKTFIEMENGLSFSISRKDNLYFFFQYLVISGNNGEVFYKKIDPVYNRFINELFD